jgi:hypothetical protein
VHQFDEVIANVLVHDELVERFGSVLHGRGQTHQLTTLVHGTATCHALNVWE